MANLYVAAVELVKCPHCGASKAVRSKQHVSGLEVMAAGYYLHGKYRGLGYFCSACLMECMRLLERHELVDIQARSGHSLPSWLKALLGDM